MRYRYKVNGTAARGQTWSSEGTVGMEQAGDFPLVPVHALKEAFDQLAGGKAVYGFPGVGCSGPYVVTSMTIVKI